MELSIVDFPTELATKKIIASFIFYRHNFVASIYDLLTKIQEIINGNFIGNCRWKFHSLGNKAYYQQRHSIGKLIYLQKFYYC